MTPGTRLLPLLTSAVLALSTLDPPAAMAQAKDPPSATQKETARGLMETGDAKFKVRDYAAALHAYRGADAIMGVPTTMFAVARAHAHLGNLVEAADAVARVRRYPEAVDEPAAYTRAREQAAELEQDLLRRIPTIRVKVHGPAKDTPVKITVDGSEVQPAADLAIRVNAGKHVVGARAPGYFLADETIRIGESERQDIELTLDVDPSYKPTPEGDVVQPVESDPGISVVTWIGFGVAAAGFIVGGASGIAALVKTNELEDECGGTACPEDLEPKHDDINLLANVSNVGFVVGGAGLVAGVVSLVLDLTREPEEDEAALTPVLGPGYVGIGGSF